MASHRGVGIIFHVALSALSALSVGAGSGEELPADIPEVLTAMETREEATARVEAAFALKTEKLEKGFLRALEKALEAAMKSGDLDASLALRKELHSARGEDVKVRDPDPDKPTPELDRLKSVYDQECAKLEAEKSRQLEQAAGNFLKALKQLEAALTKNGEGNKAMEIKRFRIAYETRGQAEQALALANSPSFEKSMSPGFGRPGRLRATGKFFRGVEVLPPEVEKVSDFVRVHAFERGWIAYRESGEAVIYVHRRRLDKYVFLNEGKIRMVTRGHDPLTLGEKNEWRREFEGSVFPFERESPDGITGSQTGGMVWWKDGTFTTGGIGFRTGRFGEPPGDFFRDVTMAQGSATAVIAMTGDGRVRSWALEERKPGDFSDLSGVLDFEVGREHAVFRRAGGSIAVRGIDGGEGQARTRPPEDLPVAVAVRAGHSMSAIRKADGRWLAWGPNASLVKAVEEAGKATDLDLFGKPDEGFVIWIEAAGTGSP